MAKLSELMPGRFFKAEDVKTPRTVTISSIDRGNIAKEDEKADVKTVMYFEEDERGCVLNRERAADLEEVLGTDDTDEMIGKKITLTVGSTLFKGKKTPCVKIVKPS
jgi:hypothetical protein